MKLPIYLDYAATTPVDPRVADKLCRYLTLDGVFGNPASRSHGFGRTAAQAVEEAREQVAALINADPSEIIWTSGATESNNLAIKGAAHYYRKKGRHLVTCKTEHKAVLDPCRHLEREGWQVTYLDPEPTGLLDLSRLAAALRDDTVLVSVMQVNNETGVIQDLAAIGQLTRHRGVLLHVDAAQSAGKVPIDLNALPVDLLSLSAHKLYGPKGSGALYVRRKPRVRLEALLHGGGQEGGLRAGTLATHQIVGMGEACRLARQEMAVDNERIHGLRERLWQGIQGNEAIYLNGDPERRVAGILNVSFDFVDGEALRMALRDIAVSSGSACTSADPEPSYVLRALGRSKPLARSAIRFGIGRFTTREEIDYTIEQLNQALARLRALSPLWELYQAGVDLNSVPWAVYSQKT
jgi:cysteine desulfurase